MRKILLLASVAGVALSAPAFAQDDAAAAPEEEATEIIVTGTPGGSELRKQDASFAITSVSADDLATAAPKSTAEVFTLVPGVWPKVRAARRGPISMCAAFRAVATPRL